MIKLYRCSNINTCTVVIGFAIWSSLIETHGCACPGDRVSYKCSVAGLEPGIGNTIWRGSALDVLCSQSGGELVLHHRSFNETRICGNITVQGIKVHVGESSCYTSQLNVTVDSRLDNETLSIECIYNDGTNKTVIGTSSVEVTKGIAMNGTTVLSIII